MDEIRHFDYTTAGIIFIVIIFVLILLLNYFIFRWIFSVGRQLRKQDVIIKTLLIIAQKSGATDAELKQLYDEHHKSYKGEL
jgi:hypothetical protein